MKKQPFYIGQRVVAINTSRFGWFKKDAEYVILDIRYCCDWLVNVGFVCTGSEEECNICKKILARKGKPAWHTYSNFSPIEEAKFKQVTYEKIIETVPMCVQ